MPAVSLTTLRARVRQRADMVSSNFIADDATGLDAFINEGVQKLHEKLVDAMGEEYVSSTSALTTVAAQSDYTLPAGFYKLYGVDLNIGGRVRALKPYMRPERNVYRENLYPNYVPRYSLVGGSLRLCPVPAGGLTGSILYAPEATTLTLPADTVTFPNGWERYVVIYAAIQALLKEESSVTALSAVLEREEQELDRIKMQRDLAAPKQVVDLDLVDTEVLY